LQHEICALASFRRGWRNPVGDQIAPRHLWQQNNNVRQSPFAKGHDRLTLPENWGQIGAGRRDFWVFAELALFWE
jgi:hypothetical protein